MSRCWWRGTPPGGPCRRCPRKTEKPASRPAPRWWQPTPPSPNLHRVPRWLLVGVGSWWMAVGPGLGPTYLPHHHLPPQGQLPWMILWSHGGPGWRDPLDDGLQHCRPPRCWSSSPRTSGQRPSAAPTASRYLRGLRCTPATAFHVSQTDCSSWACSDTAGKRHYI